MLRESISQYLSETNSARKRPVEIDIAFFLLFMSQIDISHQYTSDRHIIILEVEMLLVHKSGYPVATKIKLRKNPISAFGIYWFISGKKVAPILGKIVNTHKIGIALKLNTYEKDYKLLCAIPLK